MRFTDPPRSSTPKSHVLYLHSLLFAIPASLLLTRRGQPEHCEGVVLPARQVTQPVALLDSLLQDVHVCDTVIFLLLQPCIQYYVPSS